VKEYGMSTPLVSVIVTLKNGERFLRAALDSVFAQDYQPLDIVVVDDYSQDRSAEIAQAFEQVRFFRHECGSPSSSRNFGLEMARGEFVAFLAHDDLWTPNKVKLQVNYLLAHPEIQYTVARFKFFLDPGCVVPYGFRQELFEKDHLGRVPETLLARKALFEEIGNFDPQLITAEDVDWFARAQDRGIPMAIIPQVLLYKRVHDTNTSMNVTLNNQSMLRALRRSIQRKRREAE
jgi:glycosyltransferase involved in cell wall biosynthesis